MYEHVVVEHLPGVLFCSTYRKHSTTQRHQPAQCRQASTCRSECDNINKQTESIYCIAVTHAENSTAQSARSKPSSRYAPTRVRQRKQADREYLLLYCSTACRKQHSAISRSKPSSKYAPTRVRQRKERDREHLLLYCNTASAAQHSAIIHADQSATTQASRQRASRTVLQYRKHSTAQRNQPAQSRETITCRSECDDASEQTELSQQMSTSIYRAR